MGNTPSFQQQYRLQPLQTPISVTEHRFIAQQNIVLKLNQDISLTGDSYTITDLSNNQWFKVTRKFFSMKQTKTLKDISGKEILKLFNTFFSGYEMKSPDGGTAVTVTRKFFTRSKLIITVFDNISQQQRLLTLKTRHYNRSACVFIGEEKQNGIPIALIQRNLTFLDNYTVEIAPGADMALVIMIVLCLQELLQSKRNN